MPADGQYIADAMDLVVCVVLEKGKCTYFAPFIYGKVVGSWNNVSTSGEYPNYVYRVEDLTITADFESPTAFTAILMVGLIPAILILAICLLAVRCHILKIPLYNLS